MVSATAVPEDLQHRYISEENCSRGKISVGKAIVMKYSQRLRPSYCGRNYFELWNCTPRDFSNKQSLVGGSD